AVEEAGIAWGRRLGARQFGPAAPQPRLDGLCGRLAHRDLPLLGALAPDGDAPAREVDVARVQTAQFTNSEPAAIEELEHGIVAQAHGGLVTVDGGGRSVEQRFDLGVFEDARQPAVSTWGRQGHRGVGWDMAGPNKPAEVAPQRSRLSGDGAPGKATGG